MRVRDCVFLLNSIMGYSVSDTLGLELLQENLTYTLEYVRTHTWRPKEIDLNMGLLKIMNIQIVYSVIW